MIELERVRFTHDGLYVSEDYLESTETTASLTAEVRVGDRRTSCRLNVERSYIFEAREQQIDWQAEIVRRMREMANFYFEHLDRPD